MKKLKAIILGIVAIAEAIYLVDSLYGISLFYDDSDRNIFAFTVLSAIHALLLMLITIGGIIRLKVKEKFSLIKNLVMLPIITFLILGTGYPIAYDKSEDVLIASVFFILLFAVSFGIFVFVGGYEKHIVKKEKKQKSVAVPFEQKGFTGYNCEWLYDDVANEYCCIHGISEDSLYDEDGFADKVWYYSYVYISYFVVWLAQHHYLLNDLAYQQDKNFNAYVTDMQNETGEPVSLIQQMDGCLSPDDIRPSVHGFLTEYLDGECRYSADYESVIAKYSDYCYCNDFLWEVYHELEKLIDKAFKEYCIGKEAEEVLDTGNFFFCEWIGKDIHVNRTDDVPDEYINICIAHFSNMSDNMKNAIMKLISKLWSESDEKLSLESCNFDTINILKPYGDEPAYTIGGEPDFEQEHGITVTVRGDKVLAAGYRDEEYISPWSYDFSAEA